MSVEFWPCLWLSSVAPVRRYLTEIANQRSGVKRIPPGKRELGFWGEARRGPSEVRGSSTHSHGRVLRTAQWTGSLGYGAPSMSSKTRRRARSTAAGPTRRCRRASPILRYGPSRRSKRSGRACKSTGDPQTHPQLRLAATTELVESQLFFSFFFLKLSRFNEVRRRTSRGSRHHPPRRHRPVSACLP